MLETITLIDLLIDLGSKEKNNEDASGTKWNPEGTGSRTDDCVMAQWFVEHNLEKIYMPMSEPIRQWRPSWVTES